MKHLFYIFFCLFCCITANAQTSAVQQKYDKALAEYNEGDFVACQNTSKSLTKETDGMLRTNTYRLLALCRLALDDIDGARSYVAQMLKSDPYFTYQLDDPQLFKDLIDENKSQEAGITTASRQAESLDEAPVPVTLITEDMIQHSGATTLQELLCLYVPGMTVAEGVETNVAMHGVYSIMQDKILIMVDGHRLNSSSTNSEALDYRTSLDKIQQIEVLRGPASSLYGNVALTAVVNIITRKGAQMNGGRLTAIAGTNNTYGGSFIVGGGNNVLDIMGWGSVYYSKGIESTVDNGLSGTHAGISTLYTGGYLGRPSYDIGIKGRWKDFTMSVNLQRSKRVPYMNILQIPGNQTLTASVYGQTNFDAYRNFNYDRYGVIDGDEPGVTRNNNRINLDYSHSFTDNFDLSASGYVYFENTTMYNVLGDSINDDLIPVHLKYMEYASVASLMTGLLAQTAEDAGDQGNTFKYLVNQLLANRAYSTQGAFQKLDWSGITYGVQAQGNQRYDIGNLGNGTLTFGAQYEHFTLSSSNFLIGGNYSAAGAVSSSAIFKEGGENSISAYLQMKHYLSKKVLFNAGLRFDHKNRFSGQDIDKFSPRFSLIWKLNDVFSLRGSYNYSFVDAPYIYRASILKIFGGGSDMRPETMHSFNLGATYHNAQNHLTAEIGGFYNILNDLDIINTKVASLASATPDPESGTYKDVVLSYTYLFQNAGKVRTIGVDGSFQYTKRRFFGNFNATWQRVVTSENYIVYNSQTFSTPEFHSNATAAYSPYQGTGSGFFGSGKLWIRGTVQFQTATYYKTLDLMTTVLSALIPGSDAENASIMNRVAPQCNIGLGVSYDWKHLDIDLTVKNLTDNNYSVGSMLTDGIPRIGRQFLAKVTWKF